MWFQACGFEVEAVGFGVRFQVERFEVQGLGFRGLRFWVWGWGILWTTITSPGICVLKSKSEREANP